MCYSIACPEWHKRHFGSSQSRSGFDTSSRLPCGASLARPIRLVIDACSLEEVGKQREQNNTLRVLRDVPVPQVRDRHLHTCVQQATKQ